MTATRKAIHGFCYLIMLATLCEAIYAFFFVSESIPWFAGRISAFGWKIGESVLGGDGGHIGYGAILLLAPAVMAWGLYSNIKKHRKLQTLDLSKK